MLSELSGRLLSISDPADPGRSERTQRLAGPLSRPRPRFGWPRSDRPTPPTWPAPSSRQAACPRGRGLPRRAGRREPALLAGAGAHGAGRGFARRRRRLLPARLGGVGPGHACRRCWRPAWTPWGRFAKLVFQHAALLGDGVDRRPDHRPGSGRLRCGLAGRSSRAACCAVTRPEGSMPPTRCSARSPTRRFPPRRGATAPSGGRPGEPAGGPGPPSRPGRRVPLRRRRRSPGGRRHPGRARAAGSSVNPVLRTPPASSIGPWRWVPAARRRSSSWPACTSSPATMTPPSQTLASWPMTRRPDRRRSSEITPSPGPRMFTDPAWARPRLEAARRWRALGRRGASRLGDGQRRRASFNLSRMEEAAADLDRALAIFAEHRRPGRAVAASSFLCLARPTDRRVPAVAGRCPGVCGRGRGPDQAGGGARPAGLAPLPPLVVGRSGRHGCGGTVRPRAGRSGRGCGANETPCTAGACWPSSPGSRAASASPRPSARPGPAPAPGTPRAVAGLGRQLRGRRRRRRVDGGGALPAARFPGSGAGVAGLVVHAELVLAGRVEEALAFRCPPTAGRHRPRRRHRAAGRAGPGPVRPGRRRRSVGTASVTRRPRILDARPTEVAAQALLAEIRQQERDLPPAPSWPAGRGDAGAPAHAVLGRRDARAALQRAADALVSPGLLLGSLGCRVGSPPSWAATSPPANRLEWSYSPERATDSTAPIFAGSSPGPSLIPTEPADCEEAAALYRLPPRRRDGPKLIDCLIAAAAIRASTPDLHSDRDFEVLARYTPLQPDRP